MTASAVIVSPRPGALAYARPPAAAARSRARIRDRPEASDENVPYAPRESSSPTRFLDATHEASSERSERPKDAAAAAPRKDAAAAAPPQRLRGS